MTISDHIQSQTTNRPAPGVDGELLGSLESIVALGSLLHESRHQNTREIFDAALHSLGRVVGSRTMACWSTEMATDVGTEVETGVEAEVQAEPEQSDAGLIWSTSGAQARQLKSDLRRLHGTGALESAVAEAGLVYRPLQGTTRRIALHHVSTPTRITGIFAISFDAGSPLLGEVGEHLLSIILFQCAAADELNWVAQQMKDELDEFSSEFTARSGLVSSYTGKSQHTRAVPASKLRVLVVEDNLINRKIAARILEKLGCAVQVAGDGSVAVELARNGDFDIIFMNCKMPVMDGFEATAQIRRQEGDRCRTPIVAVTASSSDSDRDACLDSGMDDFVRKPVRQADLKGMLERWVGPRSAE